MQRAIHDATVTTAAMLEHARKQDTGLKLEVTIAVTVRSLLGSLVSSNSAVTTKVTGE